MTESNVEEIVYYFAYGSNMNPERMKERGAYFTRRHKHSLRGYSLKFNKTSVKKPEIGCANIVPDDRGIVEGVVYRITVQGLYNLDKFEGYPVHYDRITLVIDIAGSQETVKTYIAMPGKTKEGLRPAKSYMEHLLKAKYYLSEEYYEFLENLKTID
jgi:cation transport regulator ChaC